MNRLQLLCLIALIPLAGCAGDRQPMQTHSDHPASAAAMSGAMPTLPDTLTMASHPNAGSPPMTAGHGDHVSAPATDGATPDPHAGHTHAAATDAAGHDAHDGTPIYVCPMHPEVTSTQPGQRCPKCGMALVLRAEGHNTQP